jgi:AraC-like DNA-binding protein
VVVAALFPVESIALIRGLLPEAVLCMSHSLEEFTTLLKAVPLDAALIGLQADRPSDCSAIIELSDRHPNVHFLVCVSFHHSALRDVLRLSKHSISCVLLDPPNAPHPDLQRLLERVCSSHVSSAVLGSFERTLQTMPCSIVRAVEDLFQRPERYQTAADLAFQAGIRVKELYRHFASAGLGTPKKLLTLAKLARAHNTLRSANTSVSQVSRRLGYSDHRALQRATSDVFGCTPRGLGLVADSEELARHLLDWFYKPSLQRKRTLIEQ